MKNTITVSGYSIEELESRINDSVNKRGYTLVKQGKGVVGGIDLRTKYWAVLQKED
jgi:hypothetical protein